MARVGIITYHFAENYGSSFQTYALAKYLNSLDGVEASVINYITPRQEKNNSLYGHRSGLARIALNALYLPFHYWRSKKHIRFSSFIEKELPLTKRLSSLNELEQFVNQDDLAGSFNFDCLISGSDQVWNPKIVDFDLAFMYPFESGSRKTGYAISLGPALPEDLENYLPYLKDFDSISCREAGAAKALESLGLTVEQVVCDPVFLVPGNCWTELADKSEKKYETDAQYMACYFLNKENMAEYVRWAEGLAKELGLEIRIINAAFTKYSVSKGVILDAGPCEFLNLFQHAAFVCTDSFHGTALSVILQKQFLSFDAAEGSSDSRKSDLLAAAGLTERLKRVGSYNGEMVDVIEDAQFQSVQERLTDYARVSKEFIAKCVAEDKQG